MIHTINNTNSANSIKELEAKQEAARKAKRNGAPNTPPKVTGATEDLSVRAWRYQGDVYLAVVNNTRKPVAGEIGLDSDFRDLAVLQGAKGCTLKGARKVVVSFSGLETSFMRLLPQKNH